MRATSPEFRSPYFSNTSLGREIFRTTIRNAAPRVENEKTHLQLMLQRGVLRRYDEQETRSTVWKWGCDTNQVAFCDAWPMFVV